MTDETELIPAGESATQRMKAGQYIKVINTAGALATARRSPARTNYASLASALSAANSAARTLP